MPWEKIKRTDRHEGRDQPYISISRRRIAFNTAFVRQAVIDRSMRVTIYADPEELKLGFEFHKDERPDSLALMPASSDRAGGKHQGLNCSASGFLKRYPWIKSVADIADMKDRRFAPKKESPYWVIELRPSFEERKARESGDIPIDAMGIYRYLNDDRQIVYIGRGRIRERLAATEREDWDFSVVEYSIVADPDARVRWEDYWLERFKELNGGRLPRYNRQSGDGRTTDV